MFKNINEANISKNELSSMENIIIDLQKKITGLKTDLTKKNKELKILVNKLENEILEIKSVIKDNLILFLQPEKDLINKSYNN